MRNLLLFGNKSLFFMIYIVKKLNFLYLSVDENEKKEIETLLL